MNHEHDHQRCIENALELAEQRCALENVRLTELRRQVLILIWQTHKPIGAYALMQQLEKHSDRNRVAPPTVYRAIDFLIEHGLIHKVHSLNAYFGCPNPLKDHYDTLFICSTCKYTEEVPNNSIQQAINLSANKQRFHVEKQMLEILGQCRSCVLAQRKGSETIKANERIHE